MELENWLNIVVHDIANKEKPSGANAAESQSAGFLRPADR
jgi:hypothetical protein